MKRLFSLLSLCLFISSCSSAYYSAMEHADISIGNSSSGILEAASFGLPVINVGDRQAGRERSPNTIDVTGNVDDILNACLKARSPEFQDICNERQNVYGDGQASQRICAAVTDFMTEQTGARKSFHLLGGAS